MKSLDKAKTRIREAWEENPLLVIGVGAAAVTAAAKALDSMTAAKNSRTWQKEVDRRDRNSRNYRR
jgi:hypothetical protein